MKQHHRSAPFLVATFLLTAFGHAVDGATVSLRAVRVNGVPRAATNNLTVAPSDEIEAEVFVSGWLAELPGAGGVRGFHIQLAGYAGALSGDNGTVLPKGWNAPLESEACSDESECLDARYPLCAGVYGCRGAAHNPSLGAWIDENRPDFMLSGCEGIIAVDTQWLNYHYTGIAEDPSCLAFDTGVPRYVGTLVLVVSDNACGQFTFGFWPDSSLIFDGLPEPNWVNLDSQPLVLTVPECRHGPIWGWCSPAHCSIDARIPHSPTDRTERYTWSAMMQYVPEGADGMTRDDFAVSQTPNVGPLPAISSVLGSGIVATVGLNRKINASAWTCIRQVEHNRQCCMASLPGDVDGSLIVQYADILALLDNFEEVDFRLQLERCDIDRSGLCAGADLLWEVDVLSGNGAFEVYDATTLPPCPPMRINP